MSNMDRSFSCSELASVSAFPVSSTNDFEANAYALPHLGDSERQQLYLGRGEQGQTGHSPGTGLGGAFPDKIDGIPAVSPANRDTWAWRPATT